VPASRGGLELPGEAALEGETLPPADAGALCAFLKESLDQRVTKVAVGDRLTGSPVVALVPEHAMSPQMRRMMRAMDENFKDEISVELEVNPRHPLVRKLAAARSTNPELAGLVARQLLDNALMAAGLLEDARDTVGRMNAIMEQALPAD
jgi:TNF receptor-associated protein 1